MKNYLEKLEKHIKIHFDTFILFMAMLIVLLFAVICNPKGLNWPFYVSSGGMMFLLSPPVEMYTIKQSIGFRLALLIIYVLFLFVLPLNYFV